MQILYTVFQSITQEATTPANLNRVESWPEFCSEIIEPNSRLAELPKERLPLFACYHLRSNHRAADQVELISAIVLDYDNKDAEKTAIHDFYDFSFEHIIYGTYNSTAENPRFRVIVPLSVPIAAKDYFYCLSEVLEYCPLAGLDPCCKTISQVYYVPVPGDHYFTKPGKIAELNKKDFFEYSGEPNDCKILEKLRPIQIKTTYGSREFSGRTDRLKAIAWAMLERLEQDDVILLELIKIDDVHSVPLFTDPSEQYFKRGRDKNEAAQKFLDSIKKTFNRVKPIGLPAKVAQLPAEQVSTIIIEPACSSIFEFQEEKYIPKNLLESAPKVIKLLAAYFNDRAPVLNDNYAVGAALTLLSITKGREVMAQNGVFLNMYLGLVGGSSSGKSVMAEQVSDVLAQVYGASGEIGSPTSGAAVGRALAANNSVGWIRWEEFAMSSRSAFGKNAQSYEMSLMTTLMQLFDSPRLKTVPLRTYADPEKNKNIELSYPYLTICGTSTEADVTTLLASANVASGYLPRWIFINGDGLTEKKDSYTAHLKVADKIKKFLMGVKKSNYLSAELDPYILKFEAETAFYAELEALKNLQSDNADSALLDALAGKAPVLLTKIAAIAAGVAITQDDVAWGAGVVAESYRYLLYLLDQHQFNEFRASQARQSEYKLTERILAVLERSKGLPIRTDDLRATLKVRRQSIDQALRYLFESGLILEERDQSASKKPIKRYLLK